MKLVVDTNIIIAALLKQSTTRRLIANPKLELFAPDFLLDEITSHKRELLSKSGLDGETFDAFLAGIGKIVTVLPEGFYREELPAALRAVPDAKDAPFLALALALGGKNGTVGIWSEDCHFQKQTLATHHRTSQLLKLIGR